jgi:AraC-like DNA-binding protein
MARALADALADARGPRAQLQAAARWLNARLRGAPLPDPAIAWVCAQIEASRGQVPIGALCERAGLSPMRLPARFRSQVGVTPKHFARIARFRHALELLGRGAGAPALAELAADAGYADQAHFNAEFRSMAGMTLGAYLQARRFPNILSLAEAGT